MKVLMINGSPHEKGCTYTALTEVAKTLAESGIDSEIVHLKCPNIAGCRACGYCSYKHECVMDEDDVNTLIQKMSESAGLIVGSPVYYAGPAGNLMSALERMFYAAPGHILAGKPAAAIASCRRSGTTATMDRVNKFFTISQMPVVSSSYWNGVHGMTPEEILQDAEGLRTMRVIGRNMAWMIKCFEAGKAVGIEFPEQEEWIGTNFIR